MSDQIIQSRQQSLDLLAGASNRFQAVAANTLAAIKDRIALHVGERALGRLDDRQLKDIGLNRGEIRSALRSQIESRRRYLARD